MFENTEYSALNWVKGEIEETLRQARLALESYVDNPRDVTQLRFCVTYLHQVRGTLQMIELYGAALLCEEMEYLAQALMQNQIANRDDGYETLLRAILQLPTYLDRVKAGHRDVPLVLLPLLNDLRATRNQSLLSGSALFTPDLEVVPPLPVPAPADQVQTQPGSVETLARRLRPAYQTGLVGWFRNARDTDALRRMLAVVDQLRQGSESGRQLWWIAGAVLEALADGGLDSNASLKLLLGQVDREIKRLIDEGAATLAQHPTKDLVKNLLFYTGHAHSKGNRVSAVKQAFALDRLLPDAQELEQARKDLRGPDSTLIRAVSTALNDELLRINDTLDLYVRNPADSLDNLSLLETGLRQIGDTLGMLGLGVLRGKIQEQHTAIHHIVEGSVQASDAQLIKIASNLLQVESALASMAREGLVETSGSSADNVLPKAEFRQLCSRVINEALIDMGKIKAIVSQYAQQSVNPLEFGEIPLRLDLIRGGLVMLELTEAGELLDQLKGYIQQNLLNRAQEPEIRTIDALADTLTSVEYYLEAYLDSFRKRDEILSFGRRSLAILISHAVEGAVASEPLVAATKPPVSASNVDDEIIEVYLEEAEEECANIRKHLHDWQADVDDTAALAVVRRAFHTLKGGGRLVGANAVGEFSWAMEKLLNKIIDRKVEVNAAIFQLLWQAVDALPQLLNEFSTGTPPDIDSDAMIALAQQYATPVVASPAAGAQEAPKSIAGTLSDYLASVPTFTAPRPDAANEPMPVADDTSSLLDVAPPRIDTAAPPLAEIPAALYQENEILQVFLEEADELLRSIDEQMDSHAAQATAGPWIEQLHRDLHTLKGGARLAELPAIGTLGHQLESLISAVLQQQTVLTPAVTALLQRGQDRLHHMLECVRSGVRLLPADDLLADIADLLKPAAAPYATIVRTKSDEAAVAEQILKELSTPIKRPASELIRVSAETLDKLVNIAAEQGIFESRMSQQLALMRYNFTELEQTIARLFDRLRKLEMDADTHLLQHGMAQSNAEFDSLEFDRFSQTQQLARSLMESGSDLTSLHKLLYNQTREAETLLSQQTRLTSDLQDGLMRTRMVPFSSMLSRLRRLVRQVSNELGKPVELVVHGEQTELDRTLLNRLVPALEHLIRNSIDHGIEPLAARQLAGKPDAGRITIQVAHEGPEVVITLRDDGQGLDIERIRHKAIELGMLNPGARLSANEIMQFILEAGFSTAGEITQLSGRGVGMDVVNREVKQLSGTLHIGSQLGHDTQFTMRLPLTLATQNSILVNVGNDSYALPLRGFVGMTRGTPTLDDQGREVFLYNGETCLYLHLNDLVGVQRKPRENKRLPPLLIYHTGDHHIALQTDRLRGHQTIISKSVGPQLSAIQGISGGTILPDGRVALILDLHALVRNTIAHLSNYCPVAEKIQESGQQQPLIMIVDDSITMRKVTSRLLLRHDYRVITANDGVEASTLLQEVHPDVMLLDVEMPRMDGFELASLMRHTEQLKDIPIVMITSRTGDKHRARAAEIGVGHYLGKPYNEQQLLNILQDLLASEPVND